MLFTGIYNLMQEGQTLNLNVMKKGERLYICLVPRIKDSQDKTETKLIPLTLDGLPSELDEGFINAIIQPVQERFGLLTNLEAFKANNKAVAAKPVDSKSSSSATKDNKTSKTEKLKEEAEAHEKACRWPEAHAAYKKLLEADKGNVKLQEKLHSIWEKMSQRSLFSVDTEDKKSSEPDIDLVQPGLTIQPQVTETGKQEDGNRQTIPGNENIMLSPEDISPDDMFANIMRLAH